jgi:hypothetical protein
MTMPRTTRLAVPLLLALGAPLAGCGSDTSRTLGFSRDPPDEFQVTTRAPLSVPPRLGELPTPTPGATRPSDVSRAGSGLVGGLSAGTTAAAPSGAERALLAQAGQPVDDSIRRIVDEETLRLDRPDRSFVDRLMFWRDTPPPGIAVDAERETRRLRENAALGRDETDGDTPIVQPRNRSLWERLGF